MATAAIERPQCRTSPTAYEALKKHFEEHPEHKLDHPHKWDVSRSDIYADNTWQPIFREMREAGPLHYIPESPFMRLPASSGWSAVFPLPYMSTPIARYPSEATCSARFLM